MSTANDTTTKLDMVALVSQIMTKKAVSLERSALFPSPRRFLPGVDWTTQPTVNDFDIGLLAGQVWIIGLSRSSQFRTYPEEVLAMIPKIFSTENAIKNYIIPPYKEFFRDLGIVLRLHQHGSQSIINGAYETHGVRLIKIMYSCYTLYDPTKVEDAKRRLSYQTYNDVNEASKRLPPPPVPSRNAPVTAVLSCSPASPVTDVAGRSRMPTPTDAPAASSSSVAAVSGVVSNTVGPAHAAQEGPMAEAGLVRIADGTTRVAAEVAATVSRAELEDGELDDGRAASLERTGSTTPGPEAARAPPARGRPGGGAAAYASADDVAAQASLASAGGVLGPRVPHPAHPDPERWPQGPFVHPSRRSSTGRGTYTDSDDAASTERHTISRGSVHEDLLPSSSWGNTARGSAAHDDHPAADPRRGPSIDRSDIFSDIPWTYSTDSESSVQPTRRESRGGPKRSKKKKPKQQRQNHPPPDDSTPSMPPPPVPDARPPNMYGRGLDASIPPSGIPISSNTEPLQVSKRRWSTSAMEAPMHGLLAQDGPSAGWGYPPPPPTGYGSGSVTWDGYEPGPTSMDVPGPSSSGGSSRRNRGKGKQREDK